MNKNLIWVALLIIAAFVAGYELGKRSCQRRLFGGGLGPTTQAYIALQDDGSCRQTVGVDPEDYPEISKSGQATIEWMGTTAATAPIVSFPPGGSPFTLSALSNEEDSGAVTPRTPINQNYPFNSVTVFNAKTRVWVACNLNLHPMGVRIDH